MKGVGDSVILKLSICNQINLRLHVKQISYKIAGKVRLFHVTYN